MNGKFTFKDVETPVTLLKVSVVSTETRGGLPQGNRGQLIVDAYLPAEHPDGSNGSITPAHRSKLLEFALQPTKANQGPLVVTFVGNGGDEAVSTYQIAWAWVSCFEEYHPQEDDPSVAQVAGHFGQMVHVRFRAVPNGQRVDASV